MEENTMQKTDRTERQDVYTRITAQIVADLEKGVRPWVKPWNADQRFRMNSRTGRVPNPALTATSAAAASAAMPMPRRNSSPNWAQHSCAPILNWRWRPVNSG